ncbi:MAG: metallophosphoesterase [Clostridiaceae bacterium]
MGIKIFLTGDLHIGMKFNSYPENLRNLLVEARLDSLKRTIKAANEESCNIFAVAGDLFDNIKISNKDIDRVIKTLSQFSGECVLVMPGNHDYDNGMVDLWKRFKESLSEKIVLLNENRPCSLENYSINAIAYPAYCSSKHSDNNNLDWIKEIKEYDDTFFHIGLAHGSLQGLSPDMEGNYFPMTEKELLSIPMDVWLLGHTHISFPFNEKTLSDKIFNAGTPEPDGFDCRHNGNAWIIEIDNKKTVRGNRIETGIYRFYDESRDIFDQESLENIKQEFLGKDPENNLLRLSLKGRISEDLFNDRHKFYQELDKALAYFKIDDSELGIKISKEDIKKEFIEGSFPYQLLNQVSDDQEALQIAYEIIREVS